MKPLMCEMCVGADLIKDEGVFVCQSCGCKYSPEEAKRMMIEGTIEVQGTVKIDDSAVVEKCLQNARRSKEKEDWEETERYYNLVEQSQPSNIEAIFYSSYGKAKMSLVEDDFLKRQQAFKVLTNCVSIIDDNYTTENADEERVAVESICKDIVAMCRDDFALINQSNTAENNKNGTCDLFVDLSLTFEQTLKNIIEKDDQPYLHQALISLYSMLTSASFTNVTYKSRWQHDIRSERKKLENIKTSRITAYWAEHVEEKEKLDAEISLLQQQVSDLEEKIAALPESTMVIELKNRIATIENEKHSLGLFRGKEKRALQIQVDTMHDELFAAMTAIEQKAAPIRKEIRPLESKNKGGISQGTVGLGW